MSRLEIVDDPERPDGHPPAEENGAAQILSAIGIKIRDLRTSRGMTLQALGTATNLSPSMLSLVERGRASPSIGSLIVIAQALGATMSDLIADQSADGNGLVVRGNHVGSVRTSTGLIRRILRQDHERGTTVSVTDYPPNASTARHPRAHDGYEHGYVLSGELTVDVDGVSHIVRAGDLISYRSQRPHRISNRGPAPARALWFNVQGSWTSSDQVD
jgi:transcriptional regulator with XRE-family HTH domain